MKKNTFIVGIGMLGALVAATAAAGDFSDTAEVAHKLYVAKCGSCHKAPDPTQYDDATWADWLSKMRKKSRVGDEQYEVLSRYVDTLRKMQK